MAQRSYESSSPSDELIQATNCYTRFEVYLNRYRYARINLNSTSSSSVTISLNSTAMLEWKLPARSVYNLYRSYINYQIAVPAPGAGVYSAVFVDCQTLAQWVYFGDGGGLGVVDVNYCDRMTCVTAPLRTTIIEASTRDQLNLLYTTNNPSTNVLPFSSDGLLLGTVNQSTDANELQHLVFSSATATILNVAFQIPLSIFAGTYLSMDKNSIFGRDMYLRINSQYGSRIGFNTTSTANPNSTATTFTSALMPQSFLNVYLYLALEENAVLVNSLMTALNEGSIKLCIPYTYTYRYSGTANSSNMSITLTRAFGHKLKRLLYAPFVGGQSETGFSAYDHSNVNGTKVSQMQSSLDSRPLTDYQLQCFNPNNPYLPTNCGFSLPSGTLGGTSPNADDYREMRDRMLMGSCIVSYPNYQNYWSYADVFGMQNFLKQSFNTAVDDSNLNDGLNLLDADHVYSIQLTTPCISNVGAVCGGQIVHYLFALFERNLAVTPDGLQFF